MVIGDKLGLYKALATAGPTSPADLASLTHTAERYVEEWLRGQAAGGYVVLRPGDRSLLAGARIQAFTPDQQDNPFFLPGAFQLATAGRTRTNRRSPRRSVPATASAGHEHNPDVLPGSAVLHRLNSPPGRRVDPGARRDGRQLEAAPRSPTSAAATARQPSSWRWPTRRRPSSASTTTKPRSNEPASSRPRPAWPTAPRSRSRPPRTSPARRWLRPRHVLRLPP